MNELTPFGELPLEERVAMFRAHQEGKKIQILNTPDGWDPCPLPQWVSTAKYRIAPEPPSINWDHVAPEWVAMATDGSGKTYLCNVADLFPAPTRDRWTSDAVGYLYCNAQIFASFKPGTCDWRESLVLRPGTKEEEPENKFLNHYACFNCAARWTDESPYMNDDRCPECDMANSPYKSEDL